MLKRLFPIVLLLSSLTSCYHVHYAPNTVHAPLFSEKGETSIQAIYSKGVTSEFNGLELQAATAVSGHVGVMVNALTAFKEDELTEWSWQGPSSQYTEQGRGTYIEFAGGYFNRIAGRNRWIVEGYAGIGLGSATNEYRNDDRVQVNSVKYFLQPAAGYKARNFEAVIAPRLALVNWKVKEKRITSSYNDYVSFEMAAIEGQPWFWTFEPAFLIRVGGESVKGQLSLSFSQYLSGSTKKEPGDLVENLTIGLGAALRIRPKK